MVDVAEDGRGVDLCVKLVGEQAFVLGVQVRQVLDSKNAFSVLHPPVTLTGPEIESDDDESEAQQASRHILRGVPEGVSDAGPAVPIVPDVLRDHVAHEHALLEVDVAAAPPQHAVAVRAEKVLAETDLAGKLLCDIKIIRATKPLHGSFWIHTLSVEHLLDEPGVVLRTLFHSEGGQRGEKVVVAVAGRTQPVEKHPREVVLRHETSEVPRQSHVFVA